MNIPNCSQIPYRHHVSEATLMCLNVLSSMSLFNKFLSEWLVRKWMSEEWTGTDVPIERKASTVLDARKSPWKNPLY